MAPGSSIVSITVSQRRSSLGEKCSSKQMKAIFAGKVFSITGDFGSEPWTHENMARWITAHGGHYEREVTEDTTYLISTLKDFKEKSKQVRKAWKLGKNCKIVVRDWLEDCLIKGKTKKCRSTASYTCQSVLSRGKHTQKKQEGYRAAFEDGVRASKALVDNRLNHIYVDQTGFEYKVIVTRINEDGKVKSEKYTLMLFESHAKPSHYQFGARLNSLEPRRTTYYRDDCRPMQFSHAMHFFMQFFREKTGYSWDDRLLEREHDPERFRYTPPGRPVGLVPEGKERKVVDAKGSGSEGTDSGVSLGGEESGDDTSESESDSESDVEDAEDVSMSDAFPRTVPGCMGQIRA